MMWYERYKMTELQTQFNPQPKMPIVGRITPSFTPNATPDTIAVLVKQSADSRVRKFSPFDIALYREALGATQKEMGYIFATNKNPNGNNNYGANFYAWEKGVNNMPPTVANQFEKMIERHNVELANAEALLQESINSHGEAEIVKIPIIHYGLRIDDDWQLFFDDFSECLIKRSIASKLGVRYYKNVIVISFDLAAFKSYCESQHLDFNTSCRDFDVHMAWARARLIEQEKII